MDWTDDPHQVKTQKKFVTAMASRPQRQLNVQASTPEGATAWVQHERAWAGCQLCPIGCLACSKALGRGAIPCDYVLCGEGPGKGEDIVGKPFVGRAGALLDEALTQARQCPDCDGCGRSFDAPCKTCRNQGELPVKFFIMNLVACRPTDGLGKENRAPLMHEVLACKSRFAETLSLAAPARGIILMGRVPSFYFPLLAKGLPDSLQKIPVHHLTHPAAICRKGGVGSEEFLKFVSQLQTIFQGEVK